MPASLGERLRRIASRVKTAGGGLSESYVIVEVLGERRVTPVLIGEKLAGVLIGVLTLEALALKVDRPLAGLRGQSFY